MGWVKRLLSWRRAVPVGPAGEASGGLTEASMSAGQPDLPAGLGVEVRKMVLSQDPEVVSLMRLARALADRGLREPVAALVDEVWRRSRGEKLVEVWAGQMQAKYGDRERAVEVYCASEGLAPGSWEAYWHLGVFLRSCGEHARAVEFLEEAVRIELRAVDALLDLARSVEALGRGAEAKRWLTVAQHEARL